MILNTIRTYLFLFCLVFFVSAQAEQYPGFRVNGRFLYDYCGEKVILRGVSNPNIWFEQDGKPRMAEIEKTGANVVRIVWETRGKASMLDNAISNCRAENMIPMVEVHDATGDINKVQACVDYWTREDVASVLIKHEAYLLLNIANEPGDGNVKGSKFRTVYEAAILQIRGAGIHVPLVIDGTDWGKNINILQAEGPGLIEIDPDHNLIFSVHMWWPKMYGFSEKSIVSELQQSVDMELPLIVGEFSQMHGSCEESVITTNNSIAYKTIIAECEKLQVGYIAWSWFGNCNSLWDMTKSGTFNTLYDWGLEVAVDNENSIKNTSVRPYFMKNGVCDEKSGIDDHGTLKMNGFSSPINFPNPVKTETNINFSLSEAAMVKLTVSDPEGRIISTLINQKRDKGECNVLFDASKLSNGLYFYTLTVNGVEVTQKMIIMK